MTNRTIYALTVTERDTKDRLVARVIAHFEFTNEGRKACDLAYHAIPHAGMEGPIGTDAYPIGHSYFLEQS